MQNISKTDSFVSTINETGRHLCPQCDDGRGKHNPTLRVTVESDHKLYKCHHCGNKGRVSSSLPDKYKPHKQQVKRITPIPTPLNNNQQIIVNFFNDRGIDVSNTDLGDAVITGKRYFSNLDEEHDAVGFKYTHQEVPSVKWRPANTKIKEFMQTNVSLSFYGLRPMEKDAERIIIVEGEADVIALASIGIEAWSVPNGAPMKVSKGRVDAKEDKKFSFVWEAYDELISAKKVILATDADTAGDALKHELARRIGLDNCWEIKLPEGSDVTDVLKDEGSDAVKNLFANTKQLPLRGVYDVDSYFEEIESLYKNGYASGEKIGLGVCDDLFTIKEGMLYIVTGYPGDG